MERRIAGSAYKDERQGRGAPEPTDMMSAIVFTPEPWTSHDLARERETVVLSLVWLVSAVVSSVVRDVTLAVPAGLGLSEVADQSGCALVQAETEAERLTAAIAASRESRLIVIKAGFQPDGGLVDELDLFIRREAEDAVAMLLATPVTALQRLFPKRAPIVGSVLPRALADGSGGFDRLARITRRRGTVLQTRARPIR